MTSILETKYENPTRPYSINELETRRKGLYNYLRLGDVYAQHLKCNHKYYVKKNGRKEKEIQENNSPDTGNCSVCWKLKRTPRQLKESAYNVVDCYMKDFYDENKKISYESFDLENIFYKWLYVDEYEQNNFERRPRQSYNERRSEEDES